jgi:hypothetical protein
MKVSISEYPEDINEDRTVDVRVDPSDTWSLDNTLAHIILPCLKQLKETKHGHPLADNEDVPEELRSTSAPPLEHEWDVDANAEARWNWIMDEMIWAFGEASTGYEGENAFYTGEPDHRYQPVDDNGDPISDEILTWEEALAHEGDVVVVPGPNHSYSIDEEGLEAYQNRLNNAFKLFGRYYRNLWD